MTIEKIRSIAAGVFATFDSESGVCAARGRQASLVSER